MMTFAPSSRARSAGSCPIFRPARTNGFAKLTLDTLEQLAREQLSRVRRILAEEIKSLGCVPKHLIDALTRDLYTMVAAPIIEYLPLLSDADLIEIERSAYGSRPEKTPRVSARWRGLSPEQGRDALASRLFRHHRLS